MNLQKSLILWLLLAVLLHPVRGQETAGTAEKSVDSPSPDGQFAFLSTHQPDQEPQKTYDLIEKNSGKILLRAAESDEGKDRLGAEVLWSRDSKRFALCATYNHFGQELSVYVRAGDTFRKVKLSLPEADIPERRKPAHHEWKWTGINSQHAQRWQKDGSLLVRIESTLQAINSNLSLTAERTVVLGFNKAGTAAKILKSTQKVITHDGLD